MIHKTFQLTQLLFLIGTAAAQIPSAEWIEGDYHFVQLEVVTSNGGVTQSTNLSGKITFDGNGRYTFSAERLDGPANAQPLAGAGDYIVNPLGEIRLVNPLRNELDLNAKISVNRSVVVGATTETQKELWDLFVAVRAGEGLAADPLSGDYTLATLGFPGADPSRFRAGLLAFTAEEGRFRNGSITGRVHAGPIKTEELDDAVYEVGAAGAGVATFLGNSELLEKNYKIFTTADGAFVIGSSTGATRDILIGTRDHAGPASDFQGRYWIVEMNITGGQFSLATGSLLPSHSNIALLSERLRFQSNVIDFTGLNFFDVSTGTGRGWLANRFLGGEVANVALGATDRDEKAGAIVGAQFAPFDREEAVSASVEEIGLFFAVRVPSFEVAGLTVDPAGVVNGASFAMQPNPVAPGAIISVFGDGFTLPESWAVAERLPLPNELLDLSVTIDGRDAPLFFVSEAQVNLQVPYSLTSGTITVAIRSGDTVSNTVETRVAPTSPGVFSYVSPESFRAGVVTHADGRLVTANAPALRGETVVIYVTGLGETEPTVVAGDGNPSDPLARTTEQNITAYLARRRAKVLYAGGTPGFAGLYQINAVISNDTPLGLNVPLAIATGNAFHDQVDIPVAAGSAVQTIESIDLSLPGEPLPPRSRR